MALKITEQMVLNYVVNDIDLPQGIRLVSVKFDPRTRKLRHCELEKDGVALKVGDWLLSDGQIIRSRATAA